jgi:hypothetical protein
MRGVRNEIRFAGTAPSALKELHCEKELERAVTTGAHAARRLIAGRFQKFAAQAVRLCLCRKYVVSSFSLFCFAIGGDFISEAKMSRPVLSGSKRRN